MNAQYVVQVVDVVRPKIRRRPDIDRILEKLKAERVELRMGAVESWLIAADGSLLREKRFSNPVEATLYQGYVQTLALSRRIPMDVFRKRSRVLLHLHGGKTQQGYAPASDDQLHLAALLS